MLKIMWQEALQLAIYHTAEKLNSGLLKTTPTNGQNWTGLATKKRPCRVHQQSPLQRLRWVQGRVEGVATPSPIQEFMDTPLLQNRALLIMRGWQLLF